MSFLVKFCFFCGNDAIYNNGLIYVRAKDQNDEWQNVPICIDCWKKEVHKKNE